MPIIVLESLGARVCVIEYPLAVTGSVPFDEIMQSSREQLESFVGSVLPRRITFVAKSLGSAVLSSLTKDQCGSAQVESIWLTPLFNEAWVRTGAIQLGWKSLLVAGDADPYHDPQGYEEVRRALGAESLILRGANHSLEIPNAPESTVAALSDLVEAVRRFSSP